MRTIIHVPIESLAERYTEQWYRRFPQAFVAAGYKVITIDGTPLLENEIKVGAFLDINSTVHYKMSQMQKIAAMFHNQEIAHNTIFFFGDIEFWGIESIRLLADMNNVRVQLTGFLHAASYTKEDAFAIASPYQQYTEVGWIAAMDKVFVGSAYHKKQVTDLRLAPLGAFPLRDKIVVTKNPIFTDEYEKFDVPKQKKILLTNRFDHEKRPGETMALFSALQKVYPDWEFVVTTGRSAIRGDQEDVLALRNLVLPGAVKVKLGLTKSEYHRELAEAYMVVSHSIEENYGYCVAESIHYKCIPLLRNCASHSEFVSSPYLFKGSDDLSSTERAEDYVKARHWMDRFGEPSHLSLDTSGMQNIINELALL